MGHNGEFCWQARAMGFSGQSTGRSLRIHPPSADLSFFAKERRTTCGSRVGLPEAAPSTTQRLSMESIGQSTAWPYAPPRAVGTAFRWVSLGSSTTETNTSCTTQPRTELLNGLASPCRAPMSASHVYRQLPSSPRGQEVLGIRTWCERPRRVPEPLGSCTTLAPMADPGKSALQHRRTGPVGHGPAHPCCLRARPPLGIPKAPWEESSWTARSGGAYTTQPRTGQQCESDWRIGT